MFFRSQLCFGVFFFVTVINVFSEDLSEYFSLKKTFFFTKEKIDVLIPCVAKDYKSLLYCVRGISQNCLDLGRIIVVTPVKLPNRLEKHLKSFSVEIIYENIFPFTKEKIASRIFKDDTLSRAYLLNPDNRLGWILQQLVKFYIFKVISNVSSNVLVLDADTIFLNKVSFMDDNNNPFFGFSDEYHKEYFDTLDKLLPGLTKQYLKISGIAHHMLFQKDVMDELFRVIEGVHGCNLWEAICDSLDIRTMYSNVSEYEWYFNFIFCKSNQPKIRCLRWTNVHSIANLSGYKNFYDYVSWHSWMRE